MTSARSRTTKWFFLFWPYGWVKLFILFSPHKIHNVWMGTLPYPIRCPLKERKNERNERSQSREVNKITWNSIRRNTFHLLIHIVIQLFVFSSQNKLARWFLTKASKSLDCCTVCQEIQDIYKLILGLNGVWYCVCVWEGEGEGKL